MSAVEPLTAREALLEIRRFIAAGQLGAGSNGAALDLIAEAGLSRTQPINFALSDQLADRLAEAHDLLRKIEGGHYEPESLTSDLRAALALPPDLETMIERRIGPPR